MPSLLDEAYQKPKLVRPRFWLRQPKNWSFQVNSCQQDGVQIRDISPWGVRVVLPWNSRPEIEGPVTFRLVRKGDDLFTVSGVIRWIKPGRSSAMVGIEFLERGGIPMMWHNNDFAPRGLRRKKVRLIDEVRDFMIRVGHLEVSALIVGMIALIWFFTIFHILWFLNLR